MQTAIWCYFPLSAGISPHGRYQTHGQWRHLEVDATGRDRVYGWLSVGYHASGVSRSGRVGHSDPQPPTAIYRLYFTYNWQRGEWVFVRWMGPNGVNPGLSLRERMRLRGCLSHGTKDQAAVYETHKVQCAIKKAGPFIRKVRDQ
jgi:hypothetical protein